jgi:hypothetical protein
MALTDRQEKFARAIADGMTQADAYRAAYSASKMKDETIWNSAYKIMQKGEVAARVKAIRDDLAARITEKTSIDKAWVMVKLVKVVEMGMQAEIVKDDDGKVLGDGEPQNLNAANRALELIGKEFGMFIDRKEIRTGALDGLEHSQLKAINDAIEALSEPGSFDATGTGSTRH